MTSHAFAVKPELKAIQAGLVRWCVKTQRKYSWRSTNSWASASIISTYGYTKSKPVLPNSTHWATFKWFISFYDSFDGHWCIERAHCTHNGSSSPTRLLHVFFFHDSSSYVPCIRRIIWNTFLFNFLYFFSANTKHWAIVTAMHGDYFCSLFLIFVGFRSLFLQLFHSSAF